MEELKNMEISDEELENVSGGNWASRLDRNIALKAIDGDFEDLLLEGEKDIAQELFLKWDNDKRSHTATEFTEEVDRLYNKR